MPRRSARRARHIRYNDRPGEIDTDITPADYEHLECMLTSKPDVVLQWFQSRGITCLMDLEFYRRLCQENPDAAERIEASARAHGIPVWDMGDILSSMKPGEV